MLHSSRFPQPFQLAALLLSTAAIAACQQQAEAPVEENRIEEPVTNTAIPTPQPPLDRAGLLAAVAKAANATAAGSQLPEEISSLDGRQFEVRIRFGCRGPAKELRDAWLGWAYEPEKRTLRIQAKPTISKEDPLVLKIAGDAFESVEGFWIPRPWLHQAACPAGAAVTQAPAAAAPADAASAADEPTTEQQGRTAAVEVGANQSVAETEPMPKAPRIGIAQFFSSDDPRTRRRDSRPYSTVKTLPEGAPISSQGFNLVLSGRLRALPKRGVIQCIAQNPDTPPECVVSAEFQRVRIERPDSGELIAEWGSG